MGKDISFVQNIPQPTLLDIFLDAIEPLVGIIMFVGLMVILPSLIAGVIFIIKSNKENNLENKKKYKKIGKIVIISPIIIILVTFLIYLALYARSSHDSSVIF